MAVTTDKSTQVNAENSRGALTNRVPDDCGKWEYAFFTFTQGAAAGDITSTCALCRLPAGRIRVLDILLHCSAWGASRTISVGYGAGTDPGGVAIAASPAAFIAAGKDVSAALNNQKSNVATINVLLDSVTPIDVYATVAGGTVPSGATLTGWLAFARG